VKTVLGTLTMRGIPQRPDRLSVMTLVIPVPTPSVNAIHGHHWRRKHKEKALWLWLVKEARLQARIYETDAPLERARLTVERWGPRELDDDNFRAGAKWLIDSLVQEGFIVDDKPSCIGTPTYIQHLGQPYRTVVKIEST
jgi:hypothetical protein